MTEELFERLVIAVEIIAKSFERWKEVSFPEKKTPTEATVTRIKTEEDLAREAQGASDEPIEEWIGLREQRFADKAIQATVKKDPGDSENNRS